MSTGCRVLAAGDFPLIPSDEMAETIGRGKEQLSEYMKRTSNGIALEPYVAWFEASFIHRQDVPLVL